MTVRIIIDSTSDIDSDTARKLGIVLAASALKIKPMIIVKDGEVHPLGRVRTFRRAWARMKETVREFALIERLTVMHPPPPDRADRGRQNGIVATIRPLPPCHSERSGA